MITILFFYGLAFILMGIVIFAMPKKQDPSGLLADRVDGLIRGAVDYILKPYDF